MVNYILHLVYSFGVLHLVNSYATFRENIPNGELVPSPCNPNYVWQGVGHLAKNGGGPRNPFGLAFHEQGYTWTENLCRADSDNDGKTNGEELGDPDCKWSKGSGQDPERTTGLSHPGFCEPYNSTKCREINTLLDCADTEFKCEPADNDPDVKLVDIRLNETAVPAQETTYMCQALDLPDDKDYHMVATKPYIDNINVMHHIIVYGCKDGASIEPKHRQPYVCFMNGISGCDEVIGIWAVGNNGICYHEDTGFRVGKTGYKKVLMELHWNNPEEVSTYRDSSGLTLYLTPNLRAYDAGMFTIGTAELEIPPRRERYTTSSTCSSDCTREFMAGNINIFAVLNHMHYLGSGAESRMVTHDDTVHPLSYEETYSYDSPKLVTFDEPVVMRPGNRLELTCHFRSTSRSEVTRYGEGTYDEMCFAFIMYYPKSNWTSGDCIEPWLQCGADYCDFDALGDQSNPVTAERTARLYGNCEPGYCKDGCVDVVRDIFQETCFRGANMEILKSSLKGEMDPAAKLGIYDYFYRLDSCNAELEKEKCRWKPEVDGATSTNMASLSLVITVAMLICYF